MDVADLTLRLAGRAADMVAAGHGLPGGGAVLEALLRDLLQVQDQQAQTLGRIEQDVQRLIEGPWRTARLHLEECLLPGRSIKQIEASQRQAAQYLREAIGVQRGFGAAYAAFDLSIVLAALGDERASHLYAKEAIIAASDALVDMEREITRQVSADNDASAITRRWRSIQRAMQPRPEPKPELREWLLLAIAIEPICGDEFLHLQMRRLVVTRVLFPYTWQQDPIFSGQKRPSWLPH